MRVLGFSRNSADLALTEAQPDVGHFIRLERGNTRRWLGALSMVTARGVTYIDDFEIDDDNS